ncbi:MAG: Crp/Fnr family transcriptional regulator [Ferruginibacter sp.]|nr:Crp/Fnr family transcriptional regulator [Ferruginibacter sp.]
MEKEINKKQNSSPDSGCDSTLLLIRGFDIFSNLTEAEYESLNLVHNFIEAGKGDFIYFPSQNHRKLYFMKKGFIKIGYIDEAGNECIKEVIQPGEVFGQLTLEKNALQDEFAQAYKSEVSLCAFDIEDFLVLLEKKPQMAIAFSHHLGKKVRKVETRLQNLLNKTVLSRLINLLIQLIPVESGAANSASIDRFLTHDDMSKLIGASRQTVTTTIAQLENQGLISIQKNKIHIPNIELLKKAALSHS